MQLAFDNPTRSLEQLQCNEVAAVSGMNAKPLKVAAAECAFWELGILVVKQLASHFGIAVQKTANLYCALFALVQGILKFDDFVCSNILAQRLKLDYSDTSSDALLDLDEAYEIMDADEKEECRKSGKQVKDGKTIHKTFEAAWDNARPLCIATAKSKAALKSKAKAKAKPQAWENLMMSLPMGDMTQSDLKVYCPGGGSIWTDNQHGGWQAHFPPFRRQGYSSGNYGPRNSAILTLRYLWRTWMKYHGKAQQDVPIRHLFDGAKLDQVLQQPAASISSSSSVARR